MIYIGTIPSPAGILTLSGNEKKYNRTLDPGTEVFWEHIGARHAGA